MKRITSFSVDHDYIVPGVYISRVDGDITTYDLRTRRPNAGDYMDDSTMHTMEHMLATFLRNSDMAEQVIYFGPMGCQTGFYLLVRDADHEKVLKTLAQSLRQVIAHEGPVFGASRKECGNYCSLDLQCAKEESRRYLQVVEGWNVDKLAYSQNEEKEKRTHMIGIIGAMDIEIGRIQARIENSETRVIGGTVFVSGTLCGREVVAAQCGIGKVNAAVCAQTMILTYHPDLVINSGVGGSLTEQLKVGDIAVADRLVQHDVDSSALGDPIGLVSTVNQIYFPCDERAVSLIQKAAADMEKVRTVVGTIASGDQFVGSSARKQWICQHFDHVIACEMEGGAIAQTCMISGVKCAVIRAISDNADDDSHMDYGQFIELAAQRSIDLLLRFLSEY